MSQKRRRRRDGGHEPDRNQPSRAERFFQVAEAHEEAGRYGQAAAAAARCLELAPGAAAPALLRCRCLFMLKEYQEALTELDALLDGTAGYSLPESSRQEMRFRTLSVSSLCLSRMERQEEAESQASEMIALYPSRKLGYIQRGSIRNDRRDYQNALEDLHHAATLEKPNSTLHCTLGETYQNLALAKLEDPHPDCSPEQNLDDARRYFHQAVHHLHTAVDLDPGFHHGQVALEHALSHAADFRLNPDGTDA